jgi:hypothetical protein
MLVVQETDLGVEIDGNESKISEKGWKEAPNGAS